MRAVPKAASSRRRVGNAGMKSIVQNALFTITHISKALVAAGTRTATNAIHTSALAVSFSSACNKAACRPPQPVRALIVATKPRNTTITSVMKSRSTAWCNQFAVRVICGAK